MCSVAYLGITRLARLNNTAAAPVLHLPTLHSYSQTVDQATEEMAGNKTMRVVGQFTVEHGSHPFIAGVSSATGSCFIFCNGCHMSAAAGPRFNEISYLLTTVTVATTSCQLLQILG